tara:strand:+ start:78 stop:290 length:213 start_codon:yes stop_codon:yes gene_type:complete
MGPGASAPSKGVFEVISLCKGNSNPKTRLLDKKGFYINVTKKYLLFCSRCATKLAKKAIEIVCIDGKEFQ